MNEAALESAHAQVRKLQAERAKLLCAQRTAHADIERDADERRAMWDESSGFNEKNLMLRERLKESTRRVQELEVAIAHSSAPTYRDAKVGDVFVRWDIGRYNRKRTRTNQRGVLEVFDVSKPHKPNWRASNGSLVIRYLKKDGKPSMVIEPATDYGDWYPEGVVPEWGVL